MLKEPTIKFNNLILSLSDAIDLSNSKIALHQLRTAYIVWQMCKTADFGDDRTMKIYLAALFHDIGALSLEEKIRLHQFEEKFVDTHGRAGGRLFKLSHVFTPSADIIKYHHRPWHSWSGEGLSNTAMDSQIVNLADFVERSINRDQYILFQVDGIKQEVKRLSGTEFHPDLVDLFFNLTHREDFWLDITSRRLYSHLLHSGPFSGRMIKMEDLFSIASLFHHLIDFKSTFTATHTSGVAECAAFLAREIGFTNMETKYLKIAGYFHDLGKLTIPNSILEKPGKLTKNEFLIIKQHTYFTYTILNSIGGMETIARWAAFHHERFDGSGYPFHVTGDQLDLGARIIAVADIFSALTEDRPYRKKMPKDKVFVILKSNAAKKWLDSRMTELVMDNYQSVLSAMAVEQSLSRERFNNLFLPDPAPGLHNSVHSRVKKSG